jgi:hypothetical protein
MREANVRAAAPAAHRSHRALFLENLTRNLMNYFVALGARQGHVFTLRDINLQVMMNVFAPGERELLDVALAGLVADGDLRRASEPGYVLTDQGLNRVKLLRSDVARGKAGLRGVGVPLRGSSPRAITNARWSVSNAI